MERVISKPKLRNFWEQYPDSEIPLKTWFKTAQKAEWNKPNDVKLDYPSASIIKGDRMVFNIRGNNYRLIVKIDYKNQWVLIRFIGTHAEYDKIDASTI